jgi:hypothetical protein
MKYLTFSSVAWLPNSTTILSRLTADKIAARAAEIASKGWLLEPHSQERFVELFDGPTPQIQTTKVSTMQESLVIPALCIHYSLITKTHPLHAYISYLGTTWRSGAGFREELTRWGHKNSTAAIMRKDGVEISSWEDLEEIGFKVRIKIHRCILDFP